MFLDEIISAQIRGEARGILSVCSAHPWVLNAAILSAGDVPLLIEATCNQVNQFGGYTGMTPKRFVEYVRGIAKGNDLPLEAIILGGDHLGPNVWQNEPADSAMQKSGELIRDYVKAGFVKLHLDCSMRLANDPEGALDVQISAGRAAQLAKIAEATHQEGFPLPRYVIGSEVPVPGGAQGHESGVGVTDVDDARETIQVTREAFIRRGLESAWERVIAVVVQPGVEFSNDFVFEYQPSAARALSRLIESHAMVYEAHSTDYQTSDALKNLVRDHFAILKVGPRLTFAFREGVFSLAMIEDELYSKDTRSNLLRVLDNVMLQHSAHWEKYYRGSKEEQAFMRRYSFSDRIRYYWPDSQVEAALKLLMKNLGQKPIPHSLLSQFTPIQYERIRRRIIEWTPEAILLDQIQTVLSEYQAVCGH